MTWTFDETELMKRNFMRFNSVTQRQFSALLSADELTFYKINWILIDPNPAAGTNKYSLFVNQKYSNPI